MTERPPIARSPIEPANPVDEGALTITDLSLQPKWRLFSGPADIGPGTSGRSAESLVWSVSPEEWTLLGPRPSGIDSVDLTHVRAMFRLSGADAAAVLGKICALDFGDHMFPNGAAARTLVAGVTTEIVRHDKEGSPSYLLLPSSSFARYLHSVIVTEGSEFGLVEKVGGF